MTDDQLRSAIIRSRQVAERRRGDLDLLESAITYGLLILGGRRPGMDRAQVEAILEKAPMYREVVLVPDVPCPPRDDGYEEAEIMEIDGQS